MSKELNEYIKKLLEQGKNPQEIKDSLLSVGWAEKDITRAIGDIFGNSADALSPPLPQKASKHNMVEIFINFASFILLGIVAISLGTLYFQIINKYFPDALSLTKYGDYSSRYRTSAIHFSIASLFVAFPIYVWAIWFWLKSFKNNPQKIESRLSKWITYLILLFAGGTIAGDFIRVIFNFLQGGLGVRFLLKALIVLTIAGFVFGFYFLERKKIQYKKEVSINLFKIIGGSVTFLVILAIVLGFFAGGSPKNERLRKFDLERVANLQEISRGISSYARDNNRLPKDFDEILDNALYAFYLSNVNDPETQKQYEYRIISFTEYELCAEFSTSSTIDAPVRSPYGVSKWNEHSSGRVCQELRVTF